MDNLTEISGFVLAGGQSRRMGSDKCQKQFRGKPLIEYPLSVLRTFCKNVTVSVGKNNLTEYPVNILADLYPGCGPLGGIITCLEYTDTDWNAIIPCDMPFVKADFFHYLIGFIEGADVVIARSPDKLVIPVCGLFHKRILNTLMVQIESGNNTMMLAVEKVNTRIIDIPASVAGDHVNIFANINTPKDYRKLNKLSDTDNNWNNDSKCEQ